MGEILQRLSAETEVPTELLIGFGRWVLEADQQEEDGEGKQQELVGLRHFGWLPETSELQLPPTQNG